MSYDRLCLCVYYGRVPVRPKHISRPRWSGMIKRCVTDLKEGC